MLKAGCGPSNIYAVCKVETFDGKTYEGIIPFTMATFQIQFCRYGFYIENWAFGGLSLFFDFDFRGFTIQKEKEDDYSMRFFKASDEIADSLRETDYDTTYYGGFIGFPKFYFCDISEVRPENDGGFTETIFMGQKYLKPEGRGKAVSYLLLDSLDLYSEFFLNPEIFGVSLNAGKITHVPLNNIKSFRLIPNPDSKYENHYTELRKEALKQKGYSCMIMWKDPWFHNIIKKSRLEINQLNYSIYR